MTAETIAAMKREARQTRTEKYGWREPSDWGVGWDDCVAAFLPAIEQFAGCEREPSDTAELERLRAIEARAIESLRTATTSRFVILDIVGPLQPNN